MNLQLTDQQQLAISLRESAIVLSAGAGCGKTEVLVQRYLSYLEREQVAISEIVAITFTERAAREMRERIRTSISTRLATSEEEARQIFWKRQLESIETARITTIHGFCSGLIRSNGAILGIDPESDVLSDALANNLLRKFSRRELQRKLIEESQVGDDLRYLTEIYGWSSVSQSLVSLLSDPDLDAWQNWLDLTTDQIHECISKTDEHSRGAFAKFRLDTSSRTHFLDRLIYKIEDLHPTIPSRIQAVRILLEKAVNEPHDIDSILDLRQKALAPSIKKGVVKEALPRAVLDLLSDYRSILDDLAFKPSPLAGSQTSIEMGKRFLRVAIELHQEYQRHKLRESFLDFFDLQHYANALLAGNDSILKQISSQIKFLLIDEFQDTDSLQMQIASKLRLGDLQSNGLFVVGDSKQSIYRFRGAEVELFDQLRRGVPEVGRQSLTKNYRSRPDILHFVNRVFEDRLPNYEALQASRTEETNHPSVEFLWSAIDIDSHDAEVNAFTKRTLEAASIAAKIRSILDDPMPSIFDKGEKSPRRACASDIVLLFRSMSNVSIYESALRDFSIDYYLIGGRAFFAQQEIFDILQTMRAIEYPDDSLSLVGMCRSPFAGFSDDMLARLALHPQGIGVGIFDTNFVRKEFNRDESELIEFLAKRLQSWRMSKDELSVRDLLQKVIEDSCFDAALQLEPMGDRKLANLWKLLDLAKDFDQAHGFVLDDFIRQLEDSVSVQPREDQAATRPEDTNAVRLMSIHQSKGLEFPIVILIDQNSKPRGAFHEIARWDRKLGCIVRSVKTPDPAIFDEYHHLVADRVEKIAEWEESSRIFYVACTRARERLILSASVLIQQNVPYWENPCLLIVEEKFDLLSGFRHSTQAGPAQIAVTIQKEIPLYSPVASNQTEQIFSPPSWQNLLQSTPSHTILSMQDFLEICERGSSRQTDLFDDEPILASGEISQVQYSDRLQLNWVEIAIPTPKSLSKRKQSVYLGGEMQCYSKSSDTEEFFYEVFKIDSKTVLQLILIAESQPKVQIRSHLSKSSETKSISEFHEPISALLKQFWAGWEVVGSNYSGLVIAEPWS
jgi:ATP-dependent helicase/nuclease subunit A